MEKIKILHLENAPFDAELVSRELKKEKIDAEILVVDNKQKFISALSYFSPDIILSDHCLPSLDSHEAIRLVKQAGLTIPFILVTGTLTEEFAVKVMKDGAHDYVIKDRLLRLPSAVIKSIKAHRLQVAQRAQNERLVFHIENTPLGFIEWDKKFFVKSWSKRAEEIFGWTEEEFIKNKKNGFSQVYLPDLPIANKIAKDLLEEGVERNSIQLRNVTKDGKIIWCEWFNSVLKDKKGNVITVMSLVQDITERKQIEERLEYNQSRLKEAQAIAQIGNWEIDLVQNTLVWSDELFRIFGLNTKEATPSAELFLSLIHPDDFNYVKSTMDQSIKSHSASSFEHRIKLNGAIRYCYTESKFDFDKNNSPIRLYGITQDITERKLTEIERSKMVNDLTQRNKKMEQFTYIVSHNLRAPVANIMGAASGLNDPGLSSEDQNLLNHGLSESVKKLDEVIRDLNNILQVTREMEPTKEKVYFSKLIEDIKISINNLIANNDIEIKYNFAEINEFFTLKSYLYSIFYNLISNSIKYRQPDVHCMIEIRSRCLKDKIELVFTDNGMGIDLNKRGDQVFGLYKRFHAKVEGKGMGLFMVKTQVETLGGKISITSEINKGTEFLIEFEY